MGYLIINSKDNSEYRDEMRNKMSENYRRSTHMRNMGGSPGALSYKSEEAEKEAYCKGYEHGYEDAMKESQGGSEYQTSEFRYGR